MKNKAYLALLISIISVSFAAIFIRLCGDAHPLSIAFYRLFFTSLIIFPIVLLHKRSRLDLLKTSKSSLFIMIGIGLVLAAHFALWITSLDLTSVASSVILVTAHPILVGPISHIFFKEKLSTINAFGITISVFGAIILVFGNYGLPTSGIDTLEGNILAMLGGVAAGVYILGGRKMRKNVSITSYAFVVYSTGTIALFILCLIFNASVYNLDLNVYQWTLVMAFTSGILGHTLYNWSLKHIRASIASVALLGEPLGSTILAFIIPFINEIPTYYTIIGGSVILFGIFLTSRQKNSEFREYT